MKKYIETRKKQGWNINRRKTENDIINFLGLDVRQEYKNSPLLSAFCSQIGQIKPRTETGLSKRNQNLIAKAIRRSRCMGFMPYTHQMMQY